jgi:hypothetical protein
MTPEIKKALDLALEALEPFSTPNWAGTGVDKANAALTAIRQVRSAPVQEPVAWMVYTQDGKSVYVTDNPTDIQEGQGALPLYTTPPAAQPAVQEPVARIAELEETVRQLNHALREATESPTFMGEPVVAAPAARIKGFDEYGPLLEWNKHWVNFSVGTPLYTNSPAAQRPWVGLTVNERGKVYADWRWSDGRTSNLALCEAIEAKLREKNNGGSQPRESP